MTPAQINQHLLGMHTDWLSFGMYLVACLVIAVVIWGLVALFADRHADPETQQVQINRGLTWCMLAIGLLACVFGAILIFKAL